MVANSLHDVWRQNTTVLQLINLNTEEIIIEENKPVVQINEIQATQIMNSTENMRANTSHRLEKLLDEVNIGKNTGKASTAVITFITDYQDVVALDS